MAVEPRVVESISSTWRSVLRVAALSALLVCVGVGCTPSSGEAQEPQSQPGAQSASQSQPASPSQETSRSGSAAESGQPLAPAPPEGMRTAILAGGCFWCMEGPFEALEGVSEVLSGYTGGPEENPTYEAVSRGRTGHTEAVMVFYDPSVVSYAELLDVFWRSMDPTDINGQFADRGQQYRPGIFVQSAEERRIAEASRDALAADGPFDEAIVVPIVEAGPFYVAEDYHQDYYRTNRQHYESYRRGSGRTGFLQRTWGDDAY